MLLGEAGPGLRGETGHHAIVIAVAELMGRRAVRAGARQEGAASSSSSSSLVPPGCGRTLSEDRGRTTKCGGGVELPKMTGRLGEARFVFGPLVRSAWPCCFLVEGVVLSWRNLISEKNRVASSSRLCLNLSCHTLVTPQAPRARSGSAGQFPRMRMVTKPSATEKWACCFPINF